MIGVLVSLYAFLPFLLAIPGGALTDRFGTRRMLFAGVVGMVSSALLFAGTQGIAGLFAAEALAGISHFIIMVSIQAHVSLMSANSDRAFSFFTFSAALGTTVGPVIGGFVAEHFGFRSAFLVAAVAAACAAVLVTLLKKVSVESDGEGFSWARNREHIRGFLDNTGMLMAIFGSLCMLFAYGLIRSYYPLYLGEQGFTPATIGILIGIHSAASTLVRLGLYRGVQLWGRRRLFAAALAAGALGVGLTPLMGTFWLLAVVAFIAGAGKGASQPLSMILVTKNTRENERGLAMGFRIMGNRLSGFAAPLLYGLLVTCFSMDKLFYVAAFMPLFAFAVVLSWNNRQAATDSPVEVQS
jgi:MFS family permease